MAVKLQRDYNNLGVISAGSALFVYNDTLGKFEILVPTRTIPAGPGAPETIENALLTVSVNGQVEGKSSVQQKEYTINWNRDNIRRLNKYKGKQIRFLEVYGEEFTGAMFNGTISFSNSELSDNTLMEGSIYLTVTEDLGLVDDVRDIIVKTAVINTPLPEITLVGTGNVVINLDTTPNATVTATSESTSIATATLGTGENAGKLTVTGVAQGHTIIDLKATATGEAESHKTFMVDVLSE